MIKNASNLYPFAIQDQLSNGLTGQTPSVFLRQDNGSFSAASGSVTEVDSTNYPGFYQITLTAAECNCNVLTIAISLPDGQEPAILDVVYPVTTGGATPAEIWGYNGQGGRTITNTIPSAADNATAVWSAQTKEVTINSTQAETFATASALSSVADNVGAVKAKTDNLPDSPAAVGSAMTLTEATVTAVKSGLATGDNIEAALGALEMYGDTNWYTADLSGLATQTDISDAVTDIENYGQEHWQTADVSELATSTELANTQEDIISAMPTADITAIKAGLYNWELVKDGTTESITAKSGSSTVAQSTITRNSAGEIIKMEETE